MRKVAVALVVALTSVLFITALAFAGDLLDKAMDKVIDQVVPDATESERRIAKDGALSTHELGDKHYKAYTDGIKKEFGDSGSAASSGGSAQSHSGSSGGSSSGTMVAASGALECPVDGERFPADYSFCPKHGKQLIPAGGGARGDKDPQIGMEFVWVDGGCFNMGSEKGGGNDERPVHEVCVSGYYIGKFEVTQAQWERIMGNNPSKFKGGDRPVEQVSWRDAQEFIARLNKATGRNYRLPTEAEWEFAARGGTKSKGYTYSGSNAVNAVAWFDENSGGATVPVGHKEPNELGIYDMSGNVWEWCNDWYAQNYYNWSPKDNPQGPDSGDVRVERGGSWGRDAGYARASRRNRRSPGYGFDDLGLRLARTP